MEHEEHTAVGSGSGLNPKTVIIPVSVGNCFEGGAGNRLKGDLSCAPDEQEELCKRAVVRTSTCAPRFKR